MIRRVGRCLSVLMSYERYFALAHLESKETLPAQGQNRV